jgi:hypothetical protein
MSSAARKMTLGEYVDEFIEEHSIAQDEEEIILDVTSQEAEELGLGAIRLVCGWMRGLKQVRILRRLSQTGEAASDDDSIEEAEEEEIEKTFVKYRH